MDKGRITVPTGHTIRRHTGKKGYYVAKDPHGRYVKIKKENKRFLPKTWKIFTDIDTNRWYYEKGGDLTELVHGVVEITSRKHARWFEGPRNMSIGLLFGRLT